MAADPTVRPVSKLERAPLVECEDREAWRAWLEANHATSDGAWLVTWRPSSGRPVLDYEGSVEEALCFGWVDGQLGRADERRTKLYFSPRKPRSVWAASNKARVERLTAAGLMAPAGIAAVERAKANGSWSALDEVEQGIVPPDLAAALEAQPVAAANFAGYSGSTQRMILDWIRTAKRPETRAARIATTAELAAENARGADWLAARQDRSARRVG